MHTVGTVGTGDGMEWNAETYDVKVLVSLLYVQIRFFLWIGCVYVYVCMYVCIGLAE
jgi:hypothetical protein